MQIKQFTLTLRLSFLFLAAISLVFGDTPSGPSGAGRPDSQSALLGLPLSFEPNRGQTEPPVKFLSHGALSGAGYTLFLTKDSAVFEFAASRKDRNAEVVRMKLAGARAAEISAAEPLPGKVNYFIGDDSSKWLTGAPTFARVNYRHVYPGVDLTYYGTGRQLEYDFVVAPGADPSQISLEFVDANPKLAADGTLWFAGSAPLAFRKPVVYQIVNGKKKRIAGGYKLKGNHVQFALGAYDHSQPLVIDPVLDYLTYLGGAGGATYPGAPQSACAQCSRENAAQGVAVDQLGNLYVTGYTTSTAFPLSNPVQSQ